MLQWIISSTGETRAVKVAFHGPIAGFHAVYVSLCACLLVLLPIAAAPAAGQAAADQPPHVSERIPGLKASIKRDAKAVGKASRDSARRIGVAAKSFGQEVSKSAKKAGKEIGALFKGSRGSSGD